MLTILCHYVLFVLSSSSFHMLAQRNLLKMLLHHHLTGSDWTETLQSAVTWSPATDTAASWSLQAGDTAVGRCLRPMTYIFFTYMKPCASVTIISIILLFRVIFTRVLSRGLDKFEG